MKRNAERADAWLPNYVASPGAYALVGTGTVFGGIVRAPMTSVVMIFEITRDYAALSSRPCNAARSIAFST